MDVPAYCGITVPLASRLGRKPVIIVSFFIAGISLFGLAYTPSGNFCFYRFNALTKVADSTVLG